MFWRWLLDHSDHDTDSIHIDGSAKTKETFDLFDSKHQRSSFNLSIGEIEHNLPKNREMVDLSHCRHFKTCLVANL